MPIQRLLGKIDNDFNISESDWIPRVAAWVIDALSQLQCLPMEYKRRELEVDNKIAIFPCQLNATNIRVFDNCNNEIPNYATVGINNARGRNEVCNCNHTHLDTIGVTNPHARHSQHGTLLATPRRKDNQSYIISDNQIELTCDTDKIIVESLEVATYFDDMYQCEVPYIYDNGKLLEALSWYVVYKYLSRGSHHPVYDITSPNPVINPFIQWNQTKANAAASVKIAINNDRGWNNFFYNYTFLPRN